MSKLSDSDTEILNEIKESLDSLEETPRKILAAQIPCIGLEPNDHLYQETLYYYDNPNRRKDLSHQSSCGVFTEFGWGPQGANIADSRLQIPLDIRSSKGGVLYPVSLEIDIAQKMGAIHWHDGMAQELFDPQPGFAMIIGCKQGKGIWAKNTFTEEHEFTFAKIVKSYASASFVLGHSFDGGQPGIALRTRAVVYGPGKEIWMANTIEGSYEIDTDGRPKKGRRIHTCIDTTKLAVYLSSYK